MKKVLIATALLFTALPFTFDGVTPAVSKAHAIIGRPGTPMSFAGVHRRAVRRHVAFHRHFIRRPVLAAAAVSATAYGAGWGGGWGGWGWNRPLYSCSGPFCGGGWGWVRGWGWRRW